MKDLKEERARKVENKWCTSPINNDTFNTLLDEYHDYLHSNECSSTQIRTDIIAVVYKNIIDRFCRFLGLS